jgi:hypothetical protein
MPALSMELGMSGMTDEETETMDKRITRRIDWIIMPVSSRTRLDLQMDNAYADV